MTRQDRLDNGIHVYENLVKRQTDAMGDYVYTEYGDHSIWKNLLQGQMLAVAGKPYSLSSISKNLQAALSMQFGGLLKPRQQLTEESNMINQLAIDACKHINYMRLQNIYDVDKSMWEEFSRTKLTAKIPMRFLQKLQHHDPYIEFPETVKIRFIDSGTEYSMIGAFIMGAHSIAHDPTDDTSVTSTYKDSVGLNITVVGFGRDKETGEQNQRLTLRFQIDCSSAERMTIKEILETSQTSFQLYQLFQNSFYHAAFDCKALVVTGGKDARAEILTPIIGTLLYLSAKNAEVEEVKIPTSGKKAKGRKARAVSRQKRRKVGFRTGAAFRKAKAAGPGTAKRGTTPSGRKLPEPYWVGGHHHFYYAPVSGEYTEDHDNPVVVHWREGRYHAMDSGNAVTPIVRRVK